tara:strand:- start:1841 stop:2884 length:1044 start_codon:yes stop_codon:yes gene_type:complete
MSAKYNLAIVGATGNVGREIIEILEDRNFPIDQLYLVASSRSKGKTIEFNGKELIVEDLAEFDFSKAQIGLFSPGGKISSEFAPKAAKAGCIVIDNTSYFRMNKDVPLIIPEVNASDLDDFFNKDERSNIIANPNCSTIQMIVALKPLHDKAIINRVVVSTYQSVSGAGKDAMDELFNQTQNIYTNKNIEKNKFTKQMAFNVIPHIDTFVENGNTKEEEKMVNETKKILDQGIKVSATCVRVPVFIGHAESINIEFDSPINHTEAMSLLKNFDGISVIDYRKDEGYVTPVEAAGEDKVYVSRIREDASIENGLNIWVVSDNLRKGAALNAVQIAELIISKYSNNISV